MFGAVRLSPSLRFRRHLVSVPRSKSDISGLCKLFVALLNSGSNHACRLPRTRVYKTRRSISFSF